MAFRVTREEAYMVEGEAVSSSLIRKALGEGNIEKAASMLGYDYFIRAGGFRKEDRPWHGFPTANIATLSAYKLIPRSGVYAVEVIVEVSPTGTWPCSISDTGLPSLVVTGYIPSRLILLISMVICTGMK
ncbi:MAG: hypothetical protein IPI37_04820 [Bacteroidales bacterium]|nr:hypothetical protein [Bacteroidales bacterium]